MAVEQQNPDQGARRSRLGINSASARLREERDRRRRTALENALIVLGVVFALVALGVVGAYAWWNGKVGAFTAKNASMNAKVVPYLAPQRTPGKPFYVALMGIDQRSGEQVGNSDSLMIAYVDPPNRHVTLLSIPRDTRVTIPGHGVRKINAAAMLGGPPLTIRTVKQLTGLPISHYIVVNFYGFRDIVNAIGGVYVNVPTKIDDMAAAIHDPSAAVIQAGYQKLDGKHALTFVRARHQFATQDLQRVKDQQIFLKALARQTMQVKNIPNTPHIIEAIMRNVTTDMGFDEMAGLAADFKGLDAKAVETATMPGTPQYVGSISYMIPDRVAFRAMVARMEAGEPLIKKAVPAKRPTAAKLKR